MKNQSRRNFVYACSLFYFSLLILQRGLQVYHTSSQLQQLPPQKHQQHLKEDVSQQQSQQSEEKKTSMLACFKPCNCTDGYKCKC